MAKRKSDGTYDLRTKEGREAHDREQRLANSANIWAGIFKVIFGILALPFKLVWWLIKR